MSARSRAFASDLCRFLAIVVSGVGIGIVVNGLRANPLPWRYLPPAEQMLASSKVEVGFSFPSPGADTTPSESGDGGAIFTIVDVTFTSHATKDGKHLIIDARPDLFWEIGHIPGAVSLPRKSFGEAYPAMEPVLRAAVKTGKTLLIYCADRDCPDAGGLAKELYERGFQGLKLFEEGWAGWENSGQPIEAKSS